jgi:hypothetical protein
MILDDEEEGGLPCGGCGVATEVRTLAPIEGFVVYCLGCWVKRNEGRKTFRGARDET